MFWIDVLVYSILEATEAMVDLKVQLLQKDHLIEDQRDQISNIKSSIDRNESYSRRNNLIFGGIAGNTEGTCTEIIHKIFSSKLNITDYSNINFVRCHYQQRMGIWNKRRCLLQSDFKADINATNFVQSWRKPASTEISRSVYLWNSINWTLMEFYILVTVYMDYRRAYIPVPYQSDAQRECCALGGYSASTTSWVTFINVCSSIGTCPSHLLNRLINTTRLWCLVTLAQHTSFSGVRLPQRSNPWVGMLPGSTQQNGILEERLWWRNLYSKSSARMHSSNRSYVTLEPCTLQKPQSLMNSLVQVCRLHTHHVSREHDGLERMFLAKFLWIREENWRDHSNFG